MNNIYTDVSFTSNERNVIKCLKNGCVVNIPVEEENGDYKEIIRQEIPIADPD